jgi:hypothetical protein
MPLPPSKFAGITSLTETKRPVEHQPGFAAFETGGAAVLPRLSVTIGSFARYPLARQRCASWHTQQYTSSDCTPLARMLPRVMGSIGSALHPLES